MPIELEQFHQIYFEECFERLQVMESGMLHLTGDDVEQINVIFRAAYSIKGGSATFGFDEIAAFTHQLETLLDEMRKGWRPVSKDVIDLLLKSVDCLHGMIESAHNGTNFNREISIALSKEYERLKMPATPSPVLKTEVEPANASTGWRILFRPLPHIFCTGNDPVRLFRALQELGDLSVKADISRLPSFRDMDPESCYLSWELTLLGDALQKQVAEVFEWLEGDCEIKISTLNGQKPAEESAACAAAPVKVEPSISQPESVSSGEAKPASSEQERRSGADRRSGIDRRQDVSSIRVSTEKVDALINMVGELVITQAMLSQFGENFDIKKLDRLRDGLDQLERNVHELQESVLSIRMLPISFTFNRFPRLVHDLSQKLGKEVELQMSGEQTELDKTVLEKIADPLVHLVRNSLDHGIEKPEARIAAGKSAKGLVQLNACHKGGKIIIEISDDGAGINRERLLIKGRECGAVALDEELPDEKILDLIFLPGVSTAENVSDVSGRGVGMDVVRRNIRELQGQIEVHSREGQGTTFVIRLPLTLAILDGQLVRIGKENCIIPLISISESLQMEPDRVSAIGGQAEIYTLPGNHIPIVRLADAFGFKAPDRQASGTLMVVVEADGKRIGLVVDELLGQQQVVIKSLETNFKRIEGISGATILGDGTVALIIDIGGLIALSRREKQSSAKAQITGEKV